ncbi:MAG: endonuclease/exonuclease/phosphatase family protein [Armatimonadetes bacterium]|nr:endonuclease/exonuclease/phosphatase family protein [Armatimonadota bacterium]
MARYPALIMLVILSVSAHAAEGTKLTVMTYNVAYGAGVDPAEQKIVERATNNRLVGNRLDRVISVIKYVNPDIVGIQEACSWDKNDNAVAKQVARELGMHYYLAKSGKSRFNVALFSKLPIIWARGYPDHFTRAALQAQLKLPDGRALNVFVAHFNLLRAPESHLSEVRCLARQMRLRSSNLSVMMGDANFKYGIHKESTDALLASGFVIAPPVGERIDQIWTSRPLAGDIREGREIPAGMTGGASDHRPTVMVIGIPDK